MNLRQALARATQQLRKKKIATAGLDAAVLLAFLLKKPKEFIYTHPEKILTLRQAQGFKRIINRRAKHEPVAYLTNHKEFYGLDFYVDKRVLVPRPETEMIVDQVIAFAKHKKVTIADIGTGSGCVAITLAKNLPRATVYATDISGSALAVAKKNSRYHKTKIKFLTGNLLTPLKNKKIDVITANLPYIPKTNLKSQQKFTWSLKKYVDEYRATKHEPQIALAGGLKLFEKFFKQLNKYNLRPNLMIMEFGYDQKKKLKKMVPTHLPGYKAQFKKDLAGFDRLLRIEH